MSSDELIGLLGLSPDDQESSCFLQPRGTFLGRVFLPEGDTESAWHTDIDCICWRGRVGTLDKCSLSACFVPDASRVWDTPEAARDVVDMGRTFFKGGRQIENITQSHEGCLERSRSRAEKENNGLWWWWWPGQVPPSEELPRSMQGGRACCVNIEENTKESSTGACSEARGTWASSGAAGCPRWCRRRGGIG